MLALEYAAGDGAVVTPRLCAVEQAIDVAGCDGAGVSPAVAVEVTIGGAVSDVFLTLEVPAGQAGTASVTWDGGLADGFLTMAVQEEGTLTLAVCGIRRATADAVAEAASPEELTRLLADRNSLSGTLRLCVVHWDGAATVDAAAGQEMRDASSVTAVMDLRKRATAVHAPGQVTDVAVRAVDGEYEVGWPARLHGDYNQDGLVSVHDLTPLGVLFGLRQFDSTWLAEGLARVDGNGDGITSIHDITEIGREYDSENMSFRVERSVGDAAEPGTEWTSLGEVGRSGVTEWAGAVTGTGSAPYQRLLDAVAPGWTYYRVIAIGVGGLESEASAAILAPDATPPTWPEEAPALAQTDYQYEVEVEFNQTAVDDRGGPIEYRIQLTGGAGDPDELPIFFEWNTLTHEGALVSPMYLSDVLIPPDYVGSYFIRWVLGQLYYARLEAVDAAGNVASAASWVEITPRADNTTPYQFAEIVGEWDLWINREGTVRFTPPTWININSPTLKAYLYRKVIKSWESTSTDASKAEDYDVALRVPYTGGEVVWEQAVGPNEKIYIGFDLEGANEHRFTFTSVVYPNYWMEPVDLGFEAHTNYLKGFQLADGTPYLIGSIPRNGGAANENVIVFYRGGTPVVESLADLGEFHFDSYNQPQQLPLTGELLFHNPPFTDGISGETSPGELVWWESGLGVTGRATIPVGDFTNLMTRQVYVVSWLPEDADTLVGARGEPKEQPGGQLGVEIWEAQRNGAVKLRDVVYPGDMSGVSYVESLAHPARRHSLKIYKPGGFLTELAGYAVDLGNGEWAMVDATELPDAFDPAGWDDPFIYESQRVFDDDTAYFTIQATRASSNEEGYDKYVGLFCGNLASGQTSFIKCWEYISTDPIEPTLHETWFDGINYTLPIDGYIQATARKGYHSYLFAPTGEITVQPYRGGYNFSWNSNYFDNYIAKYGLGIGKVSDDGLWIEPYPLGDESEYQWGMLYTINDVE